MLAGAALCPVASIAQSDPQPPVATSQPPALPPAPAPPPPPAPPLAHRPQLRNAVQNLVAIDDYPPAAMRAEEEGRVWVILSVGLGGRAGGCFVRASSGSERLDVQTCRVLMRRARYVPATDATGQPTLGEYPHIVNWRLPDPEPVLDKDGNRVQLPPRPVPPSGPILPKPTALTDLSVTWQSAPAVQARGEQWGTVMVRLDIGVDGRVQGCEPVGYAYPEFDQRACADYSETARFSAAIGPDGQPVVSAIYASLFFRLPDSPAP